MKVILIFLLFLFAGTSYGNEDYKIISFKEAIINIPAKWKVNKKNDCLFISKKHVSASDYLKVCKYAPSDESYYFAINDDGKWEAVTDGIPVLADVNVTPKFTGMSAIVSCKYKDDAGYHTEQCFQAEIDLPINMVFIFTGRGDSSLFKDYKEVYLSFKIE